jgi:hypothetical protein
VLPASARRGVAWLRTRFLNTSVTFFCARQIVFFLKMLG